MGRKQIAPTYIYRLYGSMDSRNMLARNIVVEMPHLALEPDADTDADDPDAPHVSCFCFSFGTFF